MAQKVRLMKRALLLAIGIFLILVAPGRTVRAQSSASCRAINHAIGQGETAYLIFRAGPISVARLTEALHKTTDALHAAGINFGEPIDSCDTYTRATYDMLVIHLVDLEIAAGGTPSDLLPAITGMLRDLHGVLSISNPFFGTYTRRVVAMYTGAAGPPPEDLKSWYDDPNLGPMTDCVVPYQDAIIVSQARLLYPQTIPLSGPVTVTLTLIIGADGSLVDSKVLKSSGNGALDAAALSSARNSTYAPKVVLCQPTQGKYLFKSTFDPNR